jgi:glutathione-regulated potassium-efflux system ancillary protein KefC
MTEELIVELGFELGVVVVASAILAVVADFLRQPIIIAYVVAGFVFGPYSPWPALRLVNYTPFIEGAGTLGLVLLLFLLGVVLHPDRLLHIFRKASLVTLATSGAFFLIGFGGAMGVSVLAPAAFPLTATEAFYIGCAAAFSSTLLVVKLLPTRRLHESAVGTVAIGILIVQDLLAIVILIVTSSTAAAAQADTSFYWKVPLGVVLLAAAFPFEQIVLRRLMHKVETYTELLLVLSLAWCLLMAEGARSLGFSREIGAFVAGLTLARSPVSLYIWEKVAPLRDFFIILLFFSLGARVDVDRVLPALPLAAVLALTLVLAKPYLFGAALGLAGTEPALAREAGWRLGQSSEFAFVIGLLALVHGMIRQPAFDVILLATLISLVLSTYLVVLKYPTPLGVSENLRQG